MLYGQHVTPPLSLLYMSQACIQLLTASPPYLLLQLTGSPPCTPRCGCGMLLHPAEDDFHALLAEQNREMDTLGLQLRTLRYLPDSQTYVGLINTVRVCGSVVSAPAACECCCQRQCKQTDESNGESAARLGWQGSADAPTNDHWSWHGKLARCRGH